MFLKKDIYFDVSERKILLRFFDVIFILLALSLFDIIFDFNYFKISSANFYWIFILTIYINVFGSIFEMYNLQVSSDQYQILKSIILTASTTVLIYLLTPFFTQNLPSKRLDILLFYFIIFMTLFLWRMFYVKFLASDRFFQNVIIVCDKEQVQELVLALEEADPNYKIIAYLNANDSENEVFEYNYIKHIKCIDLTEFVLRNSVSEIIIASHKSEKITIELYQQLLLLLKTGNTIREYTQVYESKTKRIPVQYIARDFYKFFPFNRSNQNKLYLFVARILEISFSLTGLFFGLLLLPFVFLGNTLGNRGKMFYTQDRIGKDGVVFGIYKLRTMIQNAEHNGAVFTKTNDTRVTPFGKFLRKTRIDEIPQFLNVLKGDMGVIGPRPERPVFVKEILEIMPFYETRHLIKPGLTGWAQVNYSYGQFLEDSLTKLQYDLYYIKHRSFYLDLRIMLKTITTVLFYRGQ
jgi:exopolysaccharide biosynthesis polyprenyl glycosylphosphotransferase